ncbi:MAG: carbon-nitrogen hydrolase family protein [Prolixibacteraceae bacterium]
MKRVTHLFLFSVAVLTVVLACGGRVSAAKYINIAVIGDIPRVSKSQDPQKLVDQVIAFWEKQLNQVLPSRPDLIVLTEACDRPAGLSREEQLAYFEVRKDQVREYFSIVAKRNNCYIAFGTKRFDESGTLWNSTYVLDRSGKVAGIYNKNFPTIGELNSGIEASDEVPLIACDFGNVVCAICYDLNFPELLEKIRKAGPDLILFSSMYHGGLVQNYWAYASRAFFVGSIGDRGAPSQIRDPQGDVLAATTNYFNYLTARVNLDCALVHLDGNGGKLVRLKEQYGEGVTIKDPGLVGSVLVTSETDVPVAQMIREFDIELLDDYFDRSRAERVKQFNR